MRETLYYPSFFVEDEKWLKFALLYLGQVVTIIPMEANFNLSSLHSLVLNETDLLGSHSPTQNEVSFAADSLGEEISKIANNPLYSSRDLRGNLKQRNQNDWEIYDGKMSYLLKDMLLSNEWATPTENGLNMNGELAGVYMTLLANVIAEERNIPTITDKKMPVNFSKINQSIKGEYRNSQRYKTLSNELEIKLPKHLEEIDIGRIIDFRNNPRNRRNLDEFHNAIEKMNQLNDVNLSENDMLHIKKNLFDAKREYLSEIAGQFIVGSGSVLGIYQLISGDAPHIDFLREVLGIGVISGVRSAYGNVNDLRRNHRAISYLSDVENLSKKRQRNLLYHNRL
ncbi:hypothetical protein SAMN05518871_109134 [Psychrobacillus sp. OK028]|uniref:hypothetical protein n=1 Tax=Psychrobacillus sp. OK028 TaxID=1884359 RepID=UPI0008839B99|nr:hypothetical protein [Psychrobacillus sp. OK028]SDO02423.1 hypothetical protein SAMN05518871_109134 [Psychrobacillus sp. OK028]